MMTAPKRVLGMMSLLLVSGMVHAGFMPATWDLHQPLDPIQESFVNLYPVGSDAGPLIFQPLAFPNVSNFSAGSMTPTIGQPVQIDAKVSFLPELLAIDFSRLDRGARDTYTNASGAFVFSVTANVGTIASGSLQLLSPGVYSENGLWARLFDYTTQEFLFQSSQNDYGYDKTYMLGELVGNRGSTFSGSLENTLQAGHIYRFDYSIGSGNNGAGDFGSSAIGAFSLSAISPIPEPGTLALLAVGLAGLGWSRHRPIAKGRNCGISCSG